MFTFEVGVPVETLTRYVKWLSLFLIASVTEVDFAFYRISDLFNMMYTLINYFL